MPFFAILLKLPMWVKVGAGMGLLMGVMWTANWWNTRGLKKDLAKQEQLLKEAQLESARQAVDLQRESDNRLKLEEANAKQNERINSIAARARQAETAAALATIRSLQDSQAEADALRDKSTTVAVGDAAMNLWLKERFGGVK